MILPFRSFLDLHITSFRAFIQILCIFNRLVLIVVHTVLKLHLLPFVFIKPVRPLLTLHFFILAAFPSHSIMDSRFLKEEGLAILIDPLNILDRLRTALEVHDDLDPEIVDDALDALVPHHHLLVMALDLMRIAGDEQFGDVGEYLSTLPFLM